jgi:hypothetical protein
MVMGIDAGLACNNGRRNCQELKNTRHGGYSASKVSGVIGGESVTKCTTISRRRLELIYAILWTDHTTLLLVMKTGTSTASLSFCQAPGPESDGTAD